MDDEIVKRDKAANYAAGVEKRKATLAAKKAAEAAHNLNVQRLNKAPEDKPSHEGEKIAAAREGSRLNPRSGRLEVQGRNGEVLSRSAVAVSDHFEIPRNLWPEGWSYQWNLVSIHGNADIARDQANAMYSQGWRPVPAERYAGTLLPKNAKGSIIRGGVVLEERPMPLTLEAQAEDIAAAKRLISDRNESLKLTAVGKSMPDGFKARNDASGIRLQIDKSLDVLEVNREAGRYTLEK